jgi:hypothetical protein
MVGLPAVDGGALPHADCPLFNRFSPLEDLALKQRIEALLARTGFTSQGVFVMDGSRRSSHGNAYFTGFGSAKRIVFFDTLLKQLGAEEIEAVLAHELGHFKRKHIVKRISFAFACRWASCLSWGSCCMPTGSMPHWASAPQHRHGLDPVFHGRACLHLPADSLVQPDVAPSRIRSGQLCRQPGRCPASD